MIPIFPAQVHAGARHILFAKDQREYAPLPGAIDPGGLVLTEWELTAEELATVVNGGRVRLWIHTFGRPLQPVSLEVVP